MSRMTLALQRAENDRRSEFMKDHLARTYFGSGQKTGGKIRKRNKEFLIIGIVMVLVGSVCLGIVSYMYGVEKGIAQITKTVPASSISQAEITLEAKAGTAVTVTEVPTSNDPVFKTVQRAVAETENGEIEARFTDINTTVKNALSAQEESMGSKDPSVGKEDLNAVTTLLWNHGNQLIEKKNYQEARDVFLIISEKFSRGKVPDYRDIGIDISDKVQDKLQWLEKQKSLAKAAPK